MDPAKTPATPEPATPAAPVDPTPLHPQSALTSVVSASGIVVVLCIVGAFAAVFTGKAQWADVKDFIPIIAGAFIGGSAVSESARHLALGKVLSSQKEDSG